MIKLYTPLHHTIISHFKKHRLSAGFALYAMLLMGTSAKAQCIPAPVVNTVSNQVVCNNTATTTIAFTGTATSYNWTNTTPAIGLAANGVGNITSFVALNTTGSPVVATVIVTPVSGVCTGTPVSFTITVNPSPAVAVTPSVSCGGLPTGTAPCDPLTASGANSYVWSPTTGLYTDCASAIPYTGVPVALVYAAPTSNSVYTVTGTSAATGCSGSANAYVNYTPPAPLVTPSPAYLCLGGPAVKLRIMSSPNTVQFCSGPVNIAVPDNSTAGASSSVSVSGIPPCLIAQLAVTINMPHTRMGDMVFVLKAPNGNIINLDYRLTSTGGGGLTTGFVNTVISSAGTTALSAGVSPYTATFKADAQVTAGGGFGPAGPTGMLPSINNWAGLLSIPNGNWTLGFYDGATGETGTLSSWCLSITYACGTGAPSTAGVWSPIAGLYYDPAATVPYTGLAIDSVWARPSPTGVYTYQVVTQSVSPPPISFTNPAPISIPVGGTATAYPANLVVTGLPASGVTVQSVVLNGFNHTKSEDVDIILQSPSGQNVMLMSDVGGANTASATYTFSDVSPAMSITAANPTGNYKPTNNGTPDDFPAPGPGTLSQPAPALANFTGTMNGTWHLFVVDDDGTAGLGTISGGYTINFIASQAPCTSPPTTVVVNVGTAATIVTQPADQNVCIGNDAHFTVVATGTGLTYQWQVTTNGGVTFTNIVNSGPYSGATTANLTITAPPFSMNNYRYRVIINGVSGCNAVGSNSAILKVFPLPVVSIYAHPYTRLLPGLTTTLSSIVTPNTAATYTWWHDGAIVPGATADTLLVDFSAIGLYQLTVTDVNGCTGNSDTMSIRDSLHGKIFLYPNPTNGKFQVRMYSAPNSVLPRTLKVYDNMGKIVITRNYTQTVSYQNIIIDVRNYGKGLYWVEVLDKDNKRIGLNKVLVE